MDRIILGENKIQQGHDKQRKSASSLLQPSSFTIGPWFIAIED